MEPERRITNERQPQPEVGRLEEARGGRGGLRHVAQWFKRLRKVDLVVLFVLALAISCRTSQVETPDIHRAVEFGDIDGTRRALLHGAGATTTHIWVAQAQRSLHQASALHTAVVYGRVGAIKILLDGGVDINAQAQGGITPLMLAAIIGDLPVTTQLLESRASVDQQDNNGRTALHHASREGHSQIIRILVGRSAGVNVQDVNGFTPLHFVCARGMEVYQEVQSEQQLKDAVEKLRRESLDQDVAVSDLRLLLNANANPNVQNGIGMTPLHWVVISGSVKMAVVVL